MEEITNVAESVLRLGGVALFLSCAASGWALYSTGRRRGGNSALGLSLVGLSVMSLTPMRLVEHGAAALSATASQGVYGDAWRSYYHAPGCPAAHYAATYWGSSEEAAAAGLSPCPDCLDGDRPKNPATGHLLAGPK